MAENVLAQLLSPTLARQAEQQRLQGQVLATADSRNPLLAEAGRTANLMRGSAGGLFGTDLRSPQQMIAEQAKQIQASNMTQAQKIAAMKQLDLGLGTAYEQNVLANQKTQQEINDPGYTVRKIKTGETTNVLGETVDIERTALLDKQGNVVRFYDEGRPEVEVSREQTEETADQESTEGTERQALAKQLQEFLSSEDAVEAARTGRPIKLPTSNTFVRYDKELNRWVPVQIQQPDIQGELGVNP